MADGAPISQEIKLPTDTAGIAAATAKLDELIGRVDKLDHANAHQHGEAKKHHAESEGAFRSLWDTMGRVLRREAELAVGIHAIGAAGLEAKGKVNEFLEFIGAEAALEFLKKMGEELYDIGKEAIVTAAKAERLNFALEGAAGGKEGGARVREWLEANAKFSEFSDEQNAASYLQLKRFGVGDQKAGLYMKAAEDLAAMASPDERMGVYQEALGAFQRMQARGKLDARSAMRLGFGVEDFAALPQFAGQSKKAVAKALQSGAGHVTENDLLSMVVSHTGEQALGERAADASQLLLTRMTKLKDLPEQFFEKLGQTTATKKLAADIDGILEKLDPDSPAGKRIFGGLESAFTAVGDALAEVDFEAVANGLGTIASNIAPAIALFKELAHDAKAAYDAIAPVANFFVEHGPMAWVGKALADRMAKRDGLDKVPITDRMRGFDPEEAKARIHAMGGMKPAIEGPAFQPGELSSLNAAMMGAGTAAASGYAAGIKGGKRGVTSASADLGESSHTSLMESIDAHSPSRKFAKAGGFAAEGYALGIEGGAGRVDDAMDSTFSMPRMSHYDLMRSAAATGLGGGAQVTIGDITIVVQGGSTNAETAGAVRDELLRSLRPALADLLEQQDAEG